MENETKWISVQEAAGILGKSSKTIRRWIKAGKLRHKREGRRVYVVIEGTEGGTTIQTDGGTSVQTSKMAALTAKVEFQRELIDHLRRDLDDWKSQAAALTALATDQRKQIEAQAAPVVIEQDQVQLVATEDQVQPVAGPDQAAQGEAATEDQVQPVAGPDQAAQSATPEDQAGPVATEDQVQRRPWWLFFLPRK